MNHWERAIKGMKELTDNLENGVPIEATQVQRVQTPDGDMHIRRHIVLNKITPEQFHRQVAAIDLEKVPVMSTIRQIPRTEQAKLARQLFKQLGIKGTSITAPNYSMAQSVDVDIPSRRDHVKDQYGQIEWTTDPAAVANKECEDKIDAILLKAFPNHDNRSDTQIDHFNYKWSVHQSR